MRSMLLALILFITAGLLPAFAAEVKLMNKDELQIRLGSPDLLVLDARARNQWETSQFQIPGAHWVSKDEIDQWAYSLPHDKTIAVYCACNGLGSSGKVARELTARGFTRVYALDGGWKEWQASGYPVEARR